MEMGAHFTISLRALPSVLGSIDASGLSWRVQRKSGGMQIHFMPNAILGTFDAGRERLEFESLNDSGRRMNSQVAGTGS